MLFELQYFVRDNSLTSKKRDLCAVEKWRNLKSVAEHSIICVIRLYDALFIPSLVVRTMGEKEKKRMRMRCTQVILPFAMDTAQNAYISSEYTSRSFDFGSNQIVVRRGCKDALYTCIVNTTRECFLTTPDG